MTPAARQLGGFHLVTAFLIVCGCKASSPGPTDLGLLDVVIEHGRIVDGTGRAAFAGDVGIRGDRVIYIGDLSRAQTRRRIDARERVVSPGFIDMLGQSEWNLLVDNRAASKIHQGVVTEFTGEGNSVAPMNDAMRMEIDQRLLPRYDVRVDWVGLDGYFQRLESAGSTINLGSYVGATRVRRAVLGEADIQPDASQLAAMRALVEEAMQQGALGLSSALGYAPAIFAHTDELIALAEVAGRHGGIYATHLRDQGDKVLESIDEAVRIGREAHVPVEIFHLKVMGKNNRGRMRDVVQRVLDARATGLDLTADVYPYLALSNGLDVYLPPWALEGGIDEVTARLKDANIRGLIAQETRSTHFSSYDPDTIVVIGCANKELGRWVGHKLSDIAAERMVSSEDALMDLIVADKGETMVEQFAIDEDDLILALKQPWVSIGSDYEASATDGPLAPAASHPRAYGTTARVLGHYVRELGILPLEEAVRKMTSLPAAKMGQRDRGVLKAGAFADVVVFDPKTIRDLATYEKPAQYAEGVDWVIVNGKVVLDHGAITSERPGRVLRRATP